MFEVAMLDHLISAFRHQPIHHLYKRTKCNNTGHEWCFKCLTLNERYHKYMFISKYNHNLTSWLCRIELSPFQIIKIFIFIYSTERRTLSCPSVHSFYSCDYFIMFVCIILIKIFKLLNINGNYWYIDF